SVFAFLFFAQFASAQQGDIFIGGGTLLSSSATSGSYPSENGGLYINIGGDLVLHNHFGANIETAWRATQGVYGSLSNGLDYRPILTDFNLLYQPHLGKKAGLDLMAGIGAADTRFYTPGPSSPYSGYASTDHFMEHLGGGIRYYVWHHAFVRPEIHYYHIQNNTNSVADGGINFNTSNLFRVGASVGYTFGGSD
ncbi:MAG: outer membrane beta-barrel protein, partial [Candidatus Sulfotelmatobacter sp.]